MDLQLTGKLALVTGSTAGIGLAIGATLAGEGATVIIMYSGWSYWVFRGNVRRDLGYH